jgi:hypothetical protein
MKPDILKLDCLQRPLSRYEVARGIDKGPRDQGKIFLKMRILEQSKNQGGEHRDSLLLILRTELICLAGGLPLRVCVCAGGLMLRKRITNRVKGAEKTKRVSKRATVMQLLILIGQTITKSAVRRRQPDSRVNMAGPGVVSMFSDMS